jgi:hypothetical protein
MVYDRLSLAKVRKNFSGIILSYISKLSIENYDFLDSVLLLFYRHRDYIIKSESKDNFLYNLLNDVVRTTVNLKEDNQNQDLSLIYNMEYETISNQIKNKLTN